VISDLSGQILRIKLLHLATWSGSSKCIRLLLERGADPNIQDNDKWTPLHMASFHGRQKCVKVLLEGGTDPTIKDKCNHTAKYFALYLRHKDIVDLITSYEVITNPTLIE
jgi:ankyrin repeat protein